MTVGEECLASREPHIYVLNCVFNKQIPGEFARHHNSAGCRRQTTPSHGSAGSTAFAEIAVQNVSQPLRTHVVSPSHNNKKTP